MHLLEMRVELLLLRKIVTTTIELDGWSLNSSFIRKLLFLFA